MIELSADAVLRLRARSQRPAGRADGAAVPAIVRASAGIQAQDRAAAALGVRARAPGRLTHEDVRREKDAGDVARFLGSSAELRVG